MISVHYSHSASSIGRQILITLLLPSTDKFYVYSDLYISLRCLLLSLHPFLFYRRTSPRSVLQVVLLSLFIQFPIQTHRPNIPSVKTYLLPFHRAGSSSGNARFISRPDIGFPDWRFTWFSSVLADKCQDSTLTRPRALPSKSLQPISHPIIRRYAV
jgi:hypothetical protein